MKSDPARVETFLSDVIKELSEGGTHIWTLDAREYYFILDLLQRSHSRQAIHVSEPWKSFARDLIKDEWGRILYIKDQEGEEYIIPEYPVLIDLDDLIGTGEA